MTKTEFLTRLGAELKARKVADMDDILGEYSRHFDYKLADGYSEEEIAARLGSPEELAAQFESEAPEKSAKHGGGARSAVTLDRSGVSGHLCAELFPAVCLLGARCGVRRRVIGANRALPAHSL